MLAWRSALNRSHSPIYVRTSIGTALIHELPSGEFLLDMWRSNQESIGSGRFSNVEAAKARAEAILDERATCWDMLDDILLDEELGSIEPTTGGSDPRCAMEVSKAGDQTVEIGRDVRAR